MRNLKTAYSRTAPRRDFLEAGRAENASQEKGAEREDAELK